MNPIAAESQWIAAGTALWLGVLTSISPCPLASNIAAISYIGKSIAAPRRILLAGALYALGRVLMYVLLGSVLISSLVNAVSLSNGLQRMMNQILGPVLILAGMFVLELLRVRAMGAGPSHALTEHMSQWGLAGAMAIGALFALSFCPVSAALFFGSLIPLAVATGSSVAMPSLYGVGTGLPVILFAGVIGLGARALSDGFQRVAALEYWARRVTGVVFILVGLYYTLNYVFEVFS
ncbi:MAG: sulfite exporter TauE/SafE family protein [Bryobacterales bacterium]|nr:sulfite exporter TauE/SafE family protein [Bryobacterales bacterium]